MITRSYFQTRGLWVLIAVVAVAFVGGCGGASETEGMTTPMEDTVRAQKNMAEFMKNQGKSGKKTPNR